MAIRKHTSEQLPLPLSDLASENWRPVLGYEGYYEVSNQGRVRSVERFVRGPLVEQRKLQARLLGTRKNGSGRSKTRYVRTDLWQRNRRQHVLVHVLVLEAFVAPRPSGYVCNHKDGNGENNCVENLEWVTQSANVLHARDNGLIRYAAGEAMPHRLTTEQVLELRAMRKQGTSYAALARYFGVAPGTVRNIVARRKWAHVPEANL